MSSAHKQLSSMTATEGAASVPPGYKRSEIGVIPEDWAIAELRNISPEQRVGLVINPSTYFVDDGTIPMLVGSNIGENEIRWDTANRINEKSNAKLAASRLFAGDLVMVRVGEPGIAAVVPTELDGCNCASMMIVRKHNRFNSQWLCAVMNSRVGRLQVESVQYGTAQKQFNIGDAIHFLYAVPPLREQDAIAEACSDMDGLLAALDTLISKKRGIKQAAMQQLLTGKTRLPGVSGEWETKRLGELGTFLKGSGVRRDDSQSGELACVRYGEIYTVHHDYIREFHSWISPEVAAEAVQLRYGDLLFAGSGETKEEIGKCVAFLTQTDAYAGGDIVILRTTGLNSLFLGYALNMPDVAHQKSSFGQGDAVVHISAAALGQVRLALPTLEEQTAIATVLSDMDAEIAALERRRNKTRVIKQGMMQQLLTGRVRLIEPEVTPC